MARTTSRSTGRAGSMVRASRTDGFEIITAPVVHPAARLAGLVIRLRAEITALVLVFAFLAAAYSWLPPAFGSALIAVTVAVVLAVPQSRRFVGHRASAVMTRHRLRQVLVECRCLNFSRHAPLFLWSHPTEVGEVVWMLLRAGISPSDVEGECEWIASGCFARDARVTPVRSMSALVKVEVIRRDPLARELIASELDDWTATTGEPAPRSAVVVPPMPANRHWSGTGHRGTTSVPAPRPTLDDHTVASPVIDHDWPARGAEPAEVRENTDDSSTDVPEDRPEDRPVAAVRGGDWSDYV